MASGRFQNAGSVFVCATSARMRFAQIARHGYIWEMGVRANATEVARDSVHICVGAASHPKPQVRSAGKRSLSESGEDTFPYPARVRASEDVSENREDGKVPLMHVAEWFGQEELPSTKSAKAISASVSVPLLFWASLSRRA